MSDKTPHNDLFLFTFSSPEHAAAELKAILPHAVVRLADWSTLKLRSTEHAKLSVGRSDLLFSLDLSKQETFVYILFEHQSSPDRFLPLRLLRYIVGIWSDFHADHPKAPLPPVIPVVLHHSPRGWKTSTQLSQIIAATRPLPEALGPYLPNFRFLLDDISKLSDQDLRGRALTALSAATLLAFIRVRGAHTVARLRGYFAEALREVLLAPHGLDAVNRVLAYATQVSEIDYVDLRQFVIETFGETVAENLMTTAEKLKQQGLEQGLAQGRQEGRQEGRVKLLLRLITLKFGPPPDSIAQRIEQASDEDLDRFAERILTANRLEDVLA